MKYLFLFFIFLNFLHAHKINLFISQEGENLDIYSYFANGKPCKNCKLFIKHEEKILFEDKLSSEGKYSFKPTNNNIEVLIDAGEGHIAKEKVIIENIKHEDLQTHMKNEEDKKHLNIVFGLILIFLIFFLLKRFKK